MADALAYLSSTGTAMESEVVMVLLWCGVLGLAVGSFLNVVIWRVPRAQSVVSPPSTCPACGQPVRPRDNVPVLSWLLLKGRCRDCSSPISARYPLVEAGTGVAFALVAGYVGLSWELPAFLYLAAVTVALALIDIDVHRLPNAIVLPSYVVGGVLLAVPSLVAGDTGQLVRLVAGMVLLYGLYFLLAVAHPAGMGFGDVKLAGVLGMYLAWIGWSELGVGTFLAFLVGGIFGIALMLVRRAGRKSRIPFGPFMLLGAWGGIFFGDELVRSYLHALGL